MRGAMPQTAARLVSMSEFEVASQMQRHDLHKLHGLGNDFLIWFRPSVPDTASDLAVAWCNRSTGIGADGLIIAIDDRRNPQFVLFNADGGRTEVSGNGLRCFVHALARRRGVDELEVDITTDVGPKPARITSALSTTASAAVSMGVVTAGPAFDQINFDGVVDAGRIDTVDIGNPHIVLQVDDPTAYDMARVGPAIESHFLPIGINVHLAAIDGPQATMAIWERGVGVTEACGSGACAVATVAKQMHPDQSTFSITMPGGSASVEVGEQIVLTGPSTYVAAIAMTDAV